MTIRKILPKDLLSFYQSEEFQVFENQPISLKRIRSYMENPRISIHLPVLYLGFLDKKLVVYRTILQDEVLNGSVKVGWLSGVWVHPEFRRKGFAKKLLDEVLLDYDGKIFSTNLGANSLNLMQNHSDFEVLKDLKGHRFYYRFNLAKILPPKSKIWNVLKPLLNIVDGIGNASLGKSYSYKSSINNPNNFSFIEANWSQDLSDFLQSKQASSLFGRSLKEFRWILNNPWVEKSNTKKEEDVNYHFTTQSPDFEQKAFVCYQDEFVMGFLTYTIRNGMMKVHYLFFESDEILDLSCNFILEKVHSYKISCLIVGSQKVKDCIETKKGYIFSKPWSKLYFVGKTFRKQINAGQDIYLGDGDSIFV